MELVRILIYSYINRSFFLFLLLSLCLYLIMGRLCRCNCICGVGRSANHLFISGCFSCPRFYSVPDGVLVLFSFWHTYTHTLPFFSQLNTTFTPILTDPSKDIRQDVHDHPLAIATDVGSHFNAHPATVDIPSNSHFQPSTRSIPHLLLSKIFCAFDRSISSFYWFLSSWFIDSIRINFARMIRFQMLFLPQF